MNSCSRPTENQKSWLAEVLGQETWNELSGVAEFERALDTSLREARRLALNHIARKERTHHAVSIE